MQGNCLGAIDNLLIFAYIPSLWRMSFPFYRLNEVGLAMQTAAIVSLNIKFMQHSLQYLSLTKGKKKKKEKRTFEKGR